MKYTKLPKTSHAELEKKLIKKWKADKTFEKSVAFRSSDNGYVFYDGPPFITGQPHHGTLLSSVVKDVVPRFWTMKGKRVERRWGWDCHGLPAEVFTEKKLGIHDKRDIGNKISLEDYIITCRENMIQTGSEWEDTIDRIGRWVEFKNAYKTMDKDFMESVWWAFKTLYDKGSIYEGEKVLMYCTRDATPLAKAEIAMDNSYQDVTDPSVYVRFKLSRTANTKLGLKSASLLAWTTTPWTLPSNSALAIDRNINYVAVELDGEILVLAEDLLDKALTDEKHQVLVYKKLKTITGKQLEGMSYEPLFEPVEVLKHENAFKIWHADFIHTDEGTGIAHESPAYGEEDYELSKQNDIPWVMSTDENGFFTMGDWLGHNIWEVNKQIAKELKERGIVWKIEYITHSYPHCHRCQTKLMYRAHPSWFMDIASQRHEMLETNKEINWWPKHIKNGRFKNTVDSAPDWNLSRDRFWATPLPVWRGKDDNGVTHTKVLGSYKELEKLSGVVLKDYHRPWIDDVTFTIDGVKYERIDKVMDSWFEAGSMPFAQYHYPFENKQQFEQNFPGDFIVEYVAQVRAWFYYMHAVSIGLFGKPAFKNVVVTGTIAGNDGRKMSKSFGNYTDPVELVDTYSADAYRLLLVGSPLLNGEDYALIDKDVADVHRKLTTLMNTLDFFILYAEADNWQSKPEHLIAPDSTNILDRWVLSVYEDLRAHVEQHMLVYDLPNAVKTVGQFIDDLSNWYVRRSRKRFWKSINDNDKEMAYHTLYYILVNFSKVLAPFAPFMADYIYQQVSGDEQSVHLQDWPDAIAKDADLLEVMQRTRTYITDGLAARAESGIKVRQPLAKLTIYDNQELAADVLEIVAEEMNVKQVSFEVSKQYNILLDTDLTNDLIAEGAIREFVRLVQQSRKQIGLDISDHIKLEFKADTLAKAAIKDHEAYIQTETLADAVEEVVGLEGDSEKIYKSDAWGVVFRVSKI
ncbi:isoleucine--tRNA ligase [Candidatus Saccharibacteria bacterium]|nr:isoleucine--tRNA ligase [Candidatus Saccharibacteria bacterium]MCB9821303.1 isoleucine--tRNA ligase [Candidatus Nomurabacteria bacterium]